MIALLFPVLIFLYSLLFDRRRNTLPYYCFIATLYAILLYYNNALVRDTDISRYFEWQDNYKNMPWKEIFQDRDFFFPIIAKLIKNISSSFYFSLIVLSSLYAVLFWSCIKPIVFIPLNIKNWIVYLFLLSLVLVYPFTNFNALRFSFASLFFLWCIVSIVVSKKKVFYFIVLFTPYIHFSYWIFIPLPYVHFLLKNKLTIVQILFALSLLLSVVTTSLNVSIFNFASKILSDTTMDAASGYAMGSTMSERYADELARGTIYLHIFKGLFTFRTYVVSLVIFFISLISKINIKCSIEYCYIISLLLLSFTFANLANVINCGDRFYHQASNLSIFLLAFLIFKYYSAKKTNFLFKHRMLLCIACVACIIYGLTLIYTASGSSFNLVNLLVGNFFCFFI